MFFTFGFALSLPLKSKSIECSSQLKALLPNVKLDGKQPTIPTPFHRTHSVPLEGKERENRQFTMTFVEPCTKVTERGDGIGQARKVSCLPSFPTPAGTAPYVDTQLLPLALRSDNWRTQLAGLMENEIKKPYKILRATQRPH